MQQAAQSIRQTYTKPDNETGRFLTEQPSLDVRALDNNKAIYKYFSHARVLDNNKPAYKRVWHTHALDNNKSPYKRLTLRKQLSSNNLEDEYKLPNQGKAS